MLINGKGTPAVHRLRVDYDRPASGQRRSRQRRSISRRLRAGDWVGARRAATILFGISGGAVLVTSGR